MEDSVYGTHPRTMFGFTSDDRHIVLVVFDGRQSSWSVGFNYPDMQLFMKAIGCHWAFNIDGGGSSTIWSTLTGVINHPYDNRVFDHEGERRVPNIIIAK